MIQVRCIRTLKCTKDEMTPSNIGKVWNTKGNIYDIVRHDSESFTVMCDDGDPTTIDFAHNIWFVMTSFD